MKILMLSHYFGSHRGGVETVAEHLYKEVALAGETVVWLAGATSPPERVGTSRAATLPVFNCVERRTGIPFPIPTLGALRNIKSEIENVDVLLLHDCLYLTNVAGFLLARWRHLPVVLVQHTRFSPSRGALTNALIRLSTAAISRYMLTNADQVVFISEATRRSFSKVRFRRPARTIFNGVDPAMYRPLSKEESKASLRQAFDLPPGKPVVLFVGRFVAVKRVSLMKRMAELRPDYVWAFAGWGPLDPGTWNAPNVRVFHELQGAGIAALYRASDVFVLPSTGEGFPLVIQEALVSGLPVVCSTDTLSADPELAAVARGCEVFATDEERTVHGFATAIDNMLSSCADTSESDRRRSFALSRYSWQRAAEQYLEIASGLVSGSPSPQSSAGPKGVS